PFLVARSAIKWLLMTNYAEISVQSAIRESFGVRDLLLEEIVTDQVFKYFQAIIMSSTHPLTAFSATIPQNAPLKDS
ncbi:hypothetical protein, partial [Paenibacillus odorifer]|uniref:hypothetical protein n=1 Tax=Paenibacillus odorifer TaxID=189426 RepID=UPI001C4D2E22